MPKNLALINRNKQGKGNPMYGKSFSSISLLKLSNSLKDHWRDNEERKKMTSLRFKGKNNPRWKGGITPLSFKIRHCMKYKKWRDKVFKRDLYTCVKCKIRGAYIEADHYKKSFSLIMKEYAISSLKQAIDCKELWEIDNGRTLCRPCHQLTPNYLNRHILK